MELPLGYRKAGKLLDKALFDLRRLPLLWHRKYRKLTQNLVFQPVPCEPCCLARNSVIAFFVLVISSLRTGNVRLMTRALINQFRYPIISQFHCYRSSIRSWADPILLSFTHLLYAFFTVFIGTLNLPLSIFLLFHLHILLFHSTISSSRIIPVERKRGITNFDQLHGLALEYSLGAKVSSMLKEKGHGLIEQIKPIIIKKATDDNVTTGRTWHQLSLNPFCSLYLFQVPLGIMSENTPML